jgi:hypothetical protein
MKNNKIFFFLSIGLALLAVVMLLKTHKEKVLNPDFVKIALRDAGNQLLLSNHDSTSRILPIKKLDDAKFQLSFEHELAINPDTLVKVVQLSFQKANLPRHYQIEVKQCKDLEVAYSFLQNVEVEKNIIPCSGRIIPQHCYAIEVLFLKTTETTNGFMIWIGILLSSLMAIFIFFPKKKTTNQPETDDVIGISLGKFQFYPDENKLTFESNDISLSKKEVELLTIFVSNLNKTIKREELSKKVWEDHGVFVGRSLDTYISKLRKKMLDDENIKLTNVHGVGYVLEVKA